MTFQGRKKCEISITDSDTGEVRVINFSGHPGYLHAVLKGIEIHNVKNKGYAGVDNDDPLENFKYVEKEFGIRTEDGFITRICDKWCRFRNVWKQKVSYLADESLIDTMIDISNYFLLMVGYLLEKETDITAEGKTVNDFIE